MQVIVSTLVQYWVPLEYWNSGWCLTIIIDGQDLSLLAAGTIAIAERGTPHDQAQAQDTSPHTLALITLEPAHVTSRVAARVAAHVTARVFHSTCHIMPPHMNHTSKWSTSAA